MPTYVWKHKALGTVVECERPIHLSHVAPDDTGNWERVYAFGVGKVQGAGGSPARATKVKE